MLLPVKINRSPVGDLHDSYWSIPAQFLVCGKEILNSTNITFPQGHLHRSNTPDLIVIFPSFPRARITALISKHAQLTFSSPPFSDLSTHRDLQFWCVYTEGKLSGAGSDLWKEVWDWVGEFNAGMNYTKFSAATHIRHILQYVVSIIKLILCSTVTYILSINCFPT